MYSVSNTFSYYLSWMYNENRLFGGYSAGLLRPRRANWNSNVKGSRNSKGRNSECLLLILVPSISTNKQTKRILVYFILKPINNSLLSRVYSPNFWAGYLNPICADSCLSLSSCISMFSPPMPCTWQEASWLLLHASDVASPRCHLKLSHLNTCYSSFFVAFSKSKVMWQGNAVENQG